MATKAEIVKVEPLGRMALWIMTPGGILMPAATPEGGDILQVRARDASHLNWFREHYCPALGKNVATPAFDYDYRAYVHREDLARAVAAMCLDIDAVKFKPTTEGALGLRSKVKQIKLHNVYTGIWNRVYELSGKSKGWATSTAKPDPNASAQICVTQGHWWPARDGKRHKIHCKDCDALMDQATGEVTYPKSHKAWKP